MSVRWDPPPLIVVQVREEDVLSDGLLECLGSLVVLGDYLMTEGNHRYITGKVHVIGYTLHSSEENITCVMNDNVKQATDKYLLTFVHSIYIPYSAHHYHRLPGC